MVIGPDTSREAKSTEYVEIDALLRAAFGGPEEAELVQRLRADGDMFTEVVKPWQGRIVGYYALSRMPEPAGWACLAPVAVLPECQNGALGDGRHWRVGSRMMRELVTAVQGGWDGGGMFDTVVVLGKPSFYARAGFSLDRAARLTSPYPLDHTLILRPGDDQPWQRLVYPAAFG